MLDIGCNAGYMSFECKKLGADYVLGIDSNLGSDVSFVEQATFCRDALGLDIEFREQSLFEEIPEAPFHVVLFCGVLYHLENWADALDRIKELVLPKTGRIVLETAIEPVTQTLYGGEGVPQGHADLLRTLDQAAARSVGRARLPHARRPRHRDASHRRPLDRLSRKPAPLPSTRMATAQIVVSRPERRGYATRCLLAIATTDFKLKYADSLLGYVWAVLRPMAYFGVLLFVFGRFFKGVITPVHHFPLYLLLGIVLYGFFVEAVSAGLPSLVRRADLLRRLAFPRLVIPASAVLTATITFAINIAVTAIFVAATPLTPSLTWLALPALIVELLAFTFGFSLLAASVYVRFRDVMPVWELIAQLLIFATPVMYPLSILPAWARDVALANPLVQIMQDVRDLLIGLPESESFGGSGALRLLAIAVALATLIAGVVVFRRMEPRLAERV